MKKSEHLVHIFLNTITYNILFSPLSRKARKEFYLLLSAERTESKKVSSLR